VSYSLTIHQEAFEELNKAERFLEARSPGLGSRLRAEIGTCFNYIQTRPLSYAQRRGGYRYAMVANFPYRVIYAVHGTTVFIAAVYDGKRRPEGWLARRP